MPVGSDRNLWQATFESDALVCARQVSQLLLVLRDELSVELIVAMCDLRTRTGRRVAASNIATAAKLQARGAAGAGNGSLPATRVAARELSV